MTAICGTGDGTGATWGTGVGAVTDIFGTGDGTGATWGTGAGGVTATATAGAVAGVGAGALTAGAVAGVLTAGAGATTGTGHGGQPAPPEHNSTLFAVSTKATPVLFFCCIAMALVIWPVASNLSLP